MMKYSLWVMLAAAGRPQLVQRTLKSIAECRKPASYAGTLIIENGPRCGIEQVVRGFSTQHAFQYLYSEQPNKCRALNLGLAHTDGGFVVFTDDDVRVGHDWLMAYAAAVGGTADMRFFGGPVHVDAEHGLPPEWIRRYYPLALVESWELPHQGRPMSVPGQAFMGPNWAASVSEIIEAGGFDPNLGPGSDRGVGDETEVQQRLAARGSAPTYVPDAMTWHYLHQQYLDPKWLLSRTYRHGLAWGIAQTRGGKPWMRPVLAASLRRLNARIKGLLLRMAGSEQREFRAAYLEARWKGRCDGIWLGREWPEIHFQETVAPSKSRAA